MADAAPVEIEIRAIKPGDRLTGLSLGDAKFTALKTFVQRHALTCERQSLSRTYAAFNISGEGRLAGYITLVCGEVVIDEGDAALVAEDGLQYLYNQYPAGSGPEPVALHNRRGGAGGKYGWR